MTRAGHPPADLTTVALRREYNRLGELVDLVEAGRIEPAEVRAALWAAERLLASARSKLMRTPASRKVPAAR